VPYKQKWLPFYSLVFVFPVASTRTEQFFFKIEWLDYFVL
jgi:hypothetical protein